MLHCEMVANAKNVSSKQLGVLFVLRLTSSQVCTTGRRLAFAESARIAIFFAEFKPGFFYVSLEMKKLGSLAFVS